MSRTNWIAALATLCVACLLVPDMLLASPSTARMVFTLAIATALGIVLLNSGWRDRVVALLGRRHTAHVLLGAWIVVGLGMQVMKLRAFHDYPGHDQAYHVQVLWNTLEGRFGEGTILQQLHFDPPLRNHMGLHVSPAFFALLPLFAVFPHVATLLVVKIAATGVAAFALHRIARDAAGAAAATAIMAAYLLHPTVLSQWTGDFYPAILAPPALFWAILNWERKKLGWFVASLVTLLAVREDLALTVCAFVPFAIVSRFTRAKQVRRIAWYVLPPLVGIAWHQVATRVAMPWGGGDPLAENVLAWYAGLGSTPGEMIQTLVSDPLYAISVAFASSKLLYLWQVLRPLALFPLAGRHSLLALPGIAVVILVTAGVGPLDPQTHYSNVVAAGLAAGAATALAGIRARFGEKTLGAASLVLLAAALTGVPDSLNDTTLPRIQRPDHAVAVDGALALIPEHASVAAPGAFLSLVADAPTAYALDHFEHSPPGLDSPEAVVLDLLPSRISMSHDRLAQYEARLARFRADPAYEIAFEQDGIILLLRRDVERADAR